MKLLFVSDDWRAEDGSRGSGLDALCAELGWLGHEVMTAGAGAAPLKRLWDSFKPDHVHIASEGRMGAAARAIALERGASFSTFCPADPPAGLERWGAPWKSDRSRRRQFHAPASFVLAERLSMKEELEAGGLSRVTLWSPGVDARQFRPKTVPKPEHARPIWMTSASLVTGGAAEAFLRLPLAGTKWLVGDGPERDRLAARHPQARFFGELRPSNLSRLYSAADAFLFPPGRGGRFGAVLEALACGLPVAAAEGSGLEALVSDGAAVAFGSALAEAARSAQRLNRDDCRACALAHPWRKSARTFLCLTGASERPSPA